MLHVEPFLKGGTAMKCKHCGGELQKGAKFCKHCGAPQPERQMRPWPWIVTGVVAAVAVLAAVLWRGSADWPADAGAPFGDA